MLPTIAADSKIHGLPVEIHVGCSLSGTVFVAASVNLRASPWHHFNRSGLLWHRLIHGTSPCILRFPHSLWWVSRTDEHPWAAAEFVTWCGIVLPAYGYRKQNLGGRGKHGVLPRARIRSVGKDG
jgi:hypothetical protein